MSDQTSKTGDGIHVNHYCEHPGCVKWGGFGFASTKAATPRWWCWAHYPYRETTGASQSPAQSAFLP